MNMNSNKFNVYILLENYIWFSTYSIVMKKKKQLNITSLGRFTGNI